MGVNHFSDLNGETRGSSYQWPFPVLPASEIPRPSITPEVGGAPTAKQQFGDGTVELRYLRATVNAGDDIVAGSRLLNGYPDTSMLTADGQFSIISSEAITRLDIVAIGDATSGTLTAGECVAETAAEADVRTAMVTFEFAPADDVRAILISISQFYSAAAAVATATNFVMAHIEGRSYA